MGGYVKQTWAYLASGGTPINPVRLNHIEDGIVGAFGAVANVVEQFGAVGNGVDDTAAFVAALTSASNAGGGRVIAKGASYTVGAFTIPAGVKLDGDGGTLTRTGTGATFITMSNASRIRNLDIDAGGSATSARAIYCNLISGALIDGVTVRNMTAGANIQISAASYITVQGSTIDGCFHGVHVLNASQHIRIAGNWIKNHLQRAVYVAGGTTSPSDVDIVDNWITDLVGGTSNVRAMIQCLGGTGRLARIRIIGNRVIGPGKSYTAADPGSADQINCSGVDVLTIDNNLSIFGGDCGISGTSNTKVRITNNDCLYNDTSGIAQGGGAGSTTTILIVGNMSVDNGQNRNGDRQPMTRAGVYLYNAHGVTVASNNLGDDQVDGSSNPTPTQVVGIAAFNTTSDVEIGGANGAAGTIYGLYWDDGTVSNIDHQVQRQAAIPTTGVWPLGAVVRNSAPSAGGTFGWVCTTRGGASSATWAASTTYTEGQCVVLSSPLPGRVLMCLEGGQSGTTQPSVGSLGSAIVDNSVTWVYLSVASAVFKAFATVAA